MDIIHLTRADIDLHQPGWDTPGASAVFGLVQEAARHGANAIYEISVFREPSQPHHADRKFIYAAVYLFPDPPRYPDVEKLLAGLKLTQDGYQQPRISGHVHAAEPVPAGGGDVVRRLRSAISLNAQPVATRARGNTSAPRATALP